MAEAAPAYGGQRMARELARIGLQTTAILDSAIFAMMARVNKARPDSLRGRESFLRCAWVWVCGDVMAAKGARLAARTHLRFFKQLHCTALRMTKSSTGQ